MTNSIPPAPKPKPKRPAHTELRPSPSSSMQPPVPLKPRTSQPPARVAKPEDDGLEDLFNNMPV
jgi:hypothetical protein